MTVRPDQSHFISGDLSLAQGISRQPPHLRRDGQVEALLNFQPSIVDGLRRREGTELVAAITDLNQSDDLMIHLVLGSEGESYAIVYGKDASNNLILRAWDLSDGSEATVDTTSTAAVDYLELNNAASDELVLRTSGDVTFIGNRTVALGVTTSDQYTVDQTFSAIDISRTALERLYSETPLELVADETYVDDEDVDNTDITAASDFLVASAGTDFYARVASGGESVEGNYLYDTGDVTFGVYLSRQIDTPFFLYAFNYDDRDQELYLRFKMYDLPLTGVSLAFSGGKHFLDKTGGWTDYKVLNPGDTVFISVGAGSVQSGYYTIIEKVSDDRIEVDPAGELNTGGATPTARTLPDANQTGLTVSKICSARIAAIKLGGDKPVNGSFANMDQVAEYLQGIVREKATELNLSYTNDIGIRWMYKGKRWLITAPHAGAGTGVDFALYLLAGGIAGIDSDNEGYQLDGAGTGGPQRIPYADRWALTADPGIEDAAIDPAKFPVELARTALSPITLTLRPFTLVDRPNGTPESNPAPRVFTEGVKFRDLTTFDNRLLVAAGPFVAGSQAGDIGQFYVEDTTSPVDSDPLDLDTGAAGGIVYMVPMQRTVVAIGRDAQYELERVDRVTPETARFVSTTRLKTDPVSPGIGGSQLYLPGGDGRSTSVFEYQYDGNFVTSQAVDVAAHVDGLIPSGTIRIATSDTESMTLVLVGTTVYAYTQTFSGNQPVQQAWTVWSYQNTTVDLGVLGSSAYILTKLEAENGWSIERQPLSKQNAQTGFVFRPALDAWTTATGTDSGDSTLIDTDLSDGEVVDLVVGADGATLVGPWTVASGQITIDDADGDFQQACIIGKSISAATLLTRPFFNRAGGAAFGGSGGVDIGFSVDVLSIDVRVRETGQFTVFSQAINDPTDFRSNTFGPETGTRTTQYFSVLGGNMDTRQIIIQTTDPRPMTISAVRYKCKLIERRC